MNTITKGIQPERVLGFFEEISAIPRGSGNEKAIADYLEAFAKEHGFFVRRDVLHNVFIRKQASPGCEDRPALLLQGHTDIVCEKNADVEHDFLTDPLDLYVEEDWLAAHGTTLGSDNGIAVAYMLAALTEEDLRHPVLECLFTVQEEVGLCGAEAFDASVITAKHMLNLDCGPEGTATVSCAGGMCIEMEKELPQVPFTGEALKVMVCGLIGGHSGGDIHRYRGNSNKIMARLLYSLGEGISLISINGGSKHNAIPRECEALIAVPCGPCAAKKIENTAAVIKEELGEEDKGFTVSVAGVDAPATMGCAEATRKILGLLYVAPNGVLAMSHHIEGLVDASSNMGVVQTNENYIRVIFAPRASMESLNNDTETKLHLLGETFGFKTNTLSRYAGWPYSKTSPLRDTVAKIYQEMTEKEMEMRAIHGGLECGILKNKVPGLDVVALGPTATGAHSPEERLNLPSANRVWLFLKKVIERMAEQVSA